MMIRIRSVSRRSFLRAVTGTALIGGGAMLGGCRMVLGGGGCTDGDVGMTADPSGEGRKCEGRTRTGITDEDSGPNSDAVDYGRGRRPGNSTQPSGRGQPAMPGSGNQPSGLTDSDSGPQADQAGRGRSGNAGRGYNGVTDSDSGAGADPAGGGRGGGWGNGSRR